MTSIAKTARVALAVAVLALTTAGAASADAFHPDPFLQRGAPADAFHPDPFVSTGVASAVHPDPGRIQSVPFLPIREYAHPAAGRTWSVGHPATARGRDYARPSLNWLDAHNARFHLTGSGCNPRCMI